MEEASIGEWRVVKIYFVYPGTLIPWCNYPYDSDLNLSTMWFKGNYDTTAYRDEYTINKGIGRVSHANCYKRDSLG